MDYEEYKIKTNRMEEILLILTHKGTLDESLQKELDDISEEIADFEEANYPFKVASLHEMIELRMYQRKLKQKDVAALLGTTPSRISEIMNGKRGLSFELAKAMYKKLNIDPKLILEG